MKHACIIRFQLISVYITTISGNTTTFDLLIIHRVALLYLFVALVFSYFYFEGRTLVLIASVSGLCLPFVFISCFD